MYKKIIKIIVIILGIVLIINAIFLMIVSNMNTGVIGTMVLGALLIIVASAYKKIKKITQKGIGKAIKIIVIILFVLWFIFLSFIAIYGKMDNVTYKEDAIIVLGCGVKGKNLSSSLAYRLDKAIEYYNKNNNVIIVVTGGKGPQEEITEAEAMETYLLENGIPQEKIIKEELSTSTTENMENSKKILDEKINGEYEVVIITNDFHVFRADQIAKKIGLKVNDLNAKIRIETVASNYIRETAGVAKY